MRHSYSVFAGFEAAFVRRQREETFGVHATRVVRQWFSIGVMWRKHVRQLEPHLVTEIWAHVWVEPGHHNSRRQRSNMLVKPSAHSAGPTCKSHRNKRAIPCVGNVKIAQIMLPPLEIHTKININNNARPFLCKWFIISTHYFSPARTRFCILMCLACSRIQAP